MPASLAAWTMAEMFEWCGRKLVNHMPLPATGAQIGLPATTRLTGFGSASRTSPLHSQPGPVDVVTWYHGCPPVSLAHDMIEIDAPNAIPAMGSEPRSGCAYRVAGALSVPCAANGQGP